MSGRRLLSLPFLTVGGMPQPPRPPFPGSAALPHSSMPIGAIVAFPGEVRGGKQFGNQCVTVMEPLGWMLCDGRVLHRAQYPALYAAIGQKYAIETDTSETLPAYLFRIPDLQGYFLRGADPKGQVDPDTALRKTPAGKPAIAPFVGSLQSCALQAHAHNYQEPTATGTPNGQGTATTLINISSAPTSGVVVDGKNAPPQTSSSETRSVNVAVNYLIKCTNDEGPWAASLDITFPG